MSDIELEYRKRMDALPAADRVARSMTMLQWTRELLAREIIAESGPMSEDKLKWTVALRLYSSDPVTQEMIKRKLADVSG